MDFGQWWQVLLACAGGSLAIIKGIHEIVKTLTALVELKMKLKELKKQDEEGE